MVSHYAYRLDNTGRRTVVTELDGRTTAYCHDGLYRLKAETIFDTATALTEGCLTPAQRTGASYTADYQYDWTGNRTYETVGGVQTQYTYDDNDRLLQTGGTVYGYDDNGNTVSEALDGDTTTYVYNGKNQLVSTNKAGATTTYTYNPSGIRNGKTEGGVTTRFIVDENRDYAQVLEEITNGTIATVYSYGHDLISQDKNGATSFYHYDGLGSTRALSDAAGTLTDTYDYEAFGEVINQTGSTENNYLFTGEQFDQGLNQYYLRARYYNQQVGRFTQMDTWMGNNHDPITLHKYAYGNAAPVTYADPTGNFGLASFGTASNINATLTTISVGRVGLIGFAANDAVWAAGTLTARQVGFATLRAMGVGAAILPLLKKDSRETEDSKSVINLSRAVEDVELASMYTCNCFSLGRSHFPKQFFHTDAQAVKFGYLHIFGRENKSTFHLVNLGISKGFYNLLDHEAREPGIGPIMTVLNELLPAFNIEVQRNGGWHYQSTFHNNN